MTTGTAKYSKPACSFCGAVDEECGLLIQVEDKKHLHLQSVCQGNHGPF